MAADRRGLALTAADETAARRLDAAVLDYVGFGHDAALHVKAALAADPACALALCLRGYFYLMLGVPAGREKAQRALAAAEAAPANPREALHVAALRAWCAGDLTGALARWEAVTRDWPRDLLALRLAHGLYFDLGDSAAMRANVETALAAWDEGVPDYGYVLGMASFAREECGAYAEAESAGRRAVEINPADVWAVHAVAHVMEMQGRQRDGIDWLGGPDDRGGDAPAWAGRNFFVHHVWWHRALFFLDLDDHAAALDLYDRRVRDDFSEITYDMIDAASLLWRLTLAGVDVGGRWEELADKSEAHIHDHLDAFTDVHFAQCLAGAGRRDALDAMLASMKRAAEKGQGTMAPILGAVGLPLAAALAAFGRGDYGAAVEGLASVRDDIRRIGGSHAQRDLFDWTLAEAALRAGRAALARDLFAARTERKPTSIRAWRDLARAREALGDTAAAAEARARADALAREIPGS